MKVNIKSLAAGGAVATVDLNWNNYTPTQEEKDFIRRISQKIREIEPKYAGRAILIQIEEF